MCNQRIGPDIQRLVHTWERFSGTKKNCKGCSKKNVDKKQSMGVLSATPTFVITVSESYMAIRVRLSKMQNSSEIWCGDLELKVV